MRIQVVTNINSARSPGAPGSPWLGGHTSDDDIRKRVWEHLVVEQQEFPVDRLLAVYVAYSPQPQSIKGRRLMVLGVLLPGWFLRD